MPLVGEVQAAGLTVRQFQSEVQTALKQGYLKDPSVSAEVLNFRPYYILGEIGSPGKYPFTDGLTVINAVAAAGGFTYRAKKDKVFIKHIRRPDGTRIQAAGDNAGPARRHDSNSRALLLMQIRYGGLKSSSR